MFVNATLKIVDLVLVVTKLRRVNDAGGCYIGRIRELVNCWYLEAMQTTMMKLIMKLMKLRQSKIDKILQQSCRHKIDYDPDDQTTAMQPAVTPSLQSSALGVHCVA